MATKKDHFPLPFIDKMLERLQIILSFVFSMGTWGIIRFLSTLTIKARPHSHAWYGTYAYHRMLFGLCNAPASFQRCMMSIFSDMIEEIMEVFIDDFLVYGKTFDHSL
jgi:hypothetical protein